MEMDDCEEVDRKALMRVYGYRHTGMLGAIRLYCRQMYSLLLNQMAGMAPPPRLRVALQRARGVKIGKHVYLGFDVYIDHIRPDLVTIEDHAAVGHRSMVFAHRNPGWCTEIKEKYFPPFVAPTTIKRGAWVTSGSIVLAGVTIGEVSVVGAGSVVKRDVEPYTVVVGNPARLVRKLERGTDTRSGLEPSNRPSRRLWYDQMARETDRVEDERLGAQWQPETGQIQHFCDDGRRGMEDCVRADREALMTAYGYRSKGMLGVIRLSCRQMYNLVLNRLAGMATPARLRVALQRARGVKIGKHVYLGFGADIDSLYPHLITIEDHVTIGHRVMIYAHSNPVWCTEIKEKYFPPFVAPTTIKRGAWVTTGSMVLAGVTVGESSVVGGRSVARSDVEPYTIVVGNPARLVRRLERGTETRSRLEPSSRPSRRLWYDEAGHKGVKVEDDRDRA